MPLRHFLSLMDTSPDELHSIITRAQEFKQDRYANRDLLKNRSVGLIFEKSSTRTRVSFETGVANFSGHPIFMTPADSQLTRGESIRDTANVLSRMVDLIIMRTGAHERLTAMAEHASVAVINALSDYNHPCQQLADIQTFFQHRGDIKGHKVAWIGDGNNVCHSWMNAARQFQFDLTIAVPQGHGPDDQLLQDCRQYVTLCHDPEHAAKNASVVVTDTWASMGQEEEKQERIEIFKSFQVNSHIMSLADQDALFMHCLPAYRGLEVTKEVIDGPQSVVWDEAENRLHAQKALMEFLLLSQRQA